MRKYLSLGVFSASSLALEVTLTRLLSTLYYPPFIFLVLSLAVFGIALGAALVTVDVRLRTAQRVPLWMALAGLAVVVQAVGLPFSATLESPILTGVLLTLPYIGIGMSVASLFSVQSGQSQLLYAYDLVGAGLGALLVVPLLGELNPLNAMLLFAACMGLSAWLYRPHYVVAGVTTFIVIAGMANVAFDVVNVDMRDLNTPKPLQETLADGGEILETRWDAFARTDLVQPAGSQPRRIYVDGAAASVIPPAENNDFLLQDIGLFAFATAQPESVFIIGSGGGLDVWFARQIGAQSITAVEVNANSVAMVSDMPAYSDDIYAQEGVRVLVDEGRSVLRREETAYDLIYLSQVVTLTAERNGYALAENTVFTVEAFEDYWHHLADDGYLALKLYDEPTLSRSLSIVMELLGKQGKTDQDALHHTVTLLSPETSPPTPLLIVRKTPFTSQEAASIGRVAQQVGFASLYLPYIQADPPLDTIASGANDYATIIDNADLDLSAPTDNRPFFYQFERGIPSSLQTLLVISVGVVLAGMFGIGWLRIRSKPPHLMSVVLYFASLGAGFMLIELALIQMTRLFIGHPTFAVTTVLAGLLIGGGVGSAWYHRQASAKASLPVLPLLFVIGVGILWQFIFPVISDAFVGAILPVRIGLVLLALFPLAWVMGIPFAAGLRYVSEMHSYYVPLAWATNGIFTVIGSVAGVVLALQTGYLSVIMAGVASYIVALLISLLRR